MKKTAVLLLLLLTVFLTCCSGCKPENTTGDRKAVSVPVVEVKAEADRTEATISETITYTLSVLYSPSVTIRLPEPGAEIAGLRIVDFGEEGPGNIDNCMTQSRWYKLRADIAGTYIIPEMVVSYAGLDKKEKQIKTPRIFLEITADGSEQGGKKLEDIIGLKPLQEVPKNLELFVIAGVVIAFISAIALGIYLYMLKRRKADIVIQKPAHVLAFEELEILQRDNLIEKGRIKEHYFRLSDVFRKYLENRFRIFAVESTTQELFYEIKKLGAMNEKVKSDTLLFLQHSDLVKFAKYLPGLEEINKNHAGVVSIINKTKQEEQSGGSDHDAV